MFTMSDSNADGTTLLHELTLFRAKWKAPTFYFAVYNPFKKRAEQPFCCPFMLWRLGRLLYHSIVSADFLLFVRRGNGTPF